MAACCGITAYVFHEPKEETPSKREIKNSDILPDDRKTYYLSMHDSVDYYIDYLEGLEKQEKELETKFAKENVYAEVVIGQITRKSTIENVDVHGFFDESKVIPLIVERKIGQYFYPMRDYIADRGFYIKGKYEFGAKIYRNFGIMPPELKALRDSIAVARKKKQNFESELNKAKNEQSRLKNAKDLEERENATYNSMKDFYLPDVSIESINEFSGLKYNYDVISNYLDGTKNAIIYYGSVEAIESQISRKTSGGKFRYLIAEPRSPIGNKMLQDKNFDACEYLGDNFVCYDGVGRDTVGVCVPVTLREPYALRYKDLLNSNGKIDAAGIKQMLARANKLRYDIALKLSGEKYARIRSCYNNIPNKDKEILFKYSR
jgi:hypothetical protein